MDYFSEYSISYYMMQYTDPNDSDRVKYELHGDCEVYGVDKTNWVSETS